MRLHGAVRAVEFRSIAGTDAAGLPIVLSFELPSPFPLMLSRDRIQRRRYNSMTQLGLNRRFSLSPWRFG